MNDQAYREALQAFKANTKGNDDKQTSGKMNDDDYRKALQDMMGKSDGVK